MNFQMKYIKKYLKSVILIKMRSQQQQGMTQFFI